jgi:uncharacterized membrane protein YdbT with pleckstrin-like domain
MGRYVDHAISGNETVVTNAKLHWAMFIAPAFWLALGFVTFGLTLLIGIPMLISRILTYYGTELALTSKRVIAKTGVIRRDVVDVSLTKVEGITYQQGIIGRLFGYGSVFVRGTGLGHVPVKFISYPEMFKSDVDRLLHAD